jgi:hypothetical protein
MIFNPWHINNVTRRPELGSPSWCMFLCVCVCVYVK